VAAAECATAADTPAEDGMAKDATAELFKKGWTCYGGANRSSQSHITMDTTAEIRRSLRVLCSEKQQHAS